MDRDAMRPRYFVSTQQNSALLATASCQTKTAEVPRQLQQPIRLEKLDFAAGAKAYKKQKLSGGIFHGIKIATILSGFVLVVVLAFGVWLNHTYSGRALPFTYIGGMSVGGLTEPEIKAALDARTKELSVILVDGGYKKEIDPSKFGVTFDTAKASKQAVTGSNPLNYLNRRSFSVPVSLKDYQVDGYLRLHVSRTQTTPKDAELVVENGKLVIRSETTGFRTDAKFVSEGIKIGLSNLQDAVVNVNAANTKPNITSSDLADDVQRANQLLASNITIANGNYVHQVPLSEKLKWLEITTSSTPKDITLNFSSSLVREYVLSLALRYEKPVKISATEQRSAKVQNVDEVAAAITAAINAGQATNQNFLISYSTTQVAPSAVPAIEPATEPPASEETPPSEPVASAL